MKKIVVLLFCLIFSVMSMAMSVELRGGIDSGSEDSKSDSSNTTKITSGYSAKAEILYGEMFEYGFGLGYKQFGNTESNTAAFDGKTYITSTLLYGTSKFNLGESGFSPYLRVNAGYAMNTAGEFFDEFVTLYQAWSATATVGNGVYYGAGLGLEISNFLVEIAYENIASEIKLGLLGVETSNVVNLNTITFEFGYKFGMGS